MGGPAYDATLAAGATVSGSQAVLASSGPYVSLPSTVFGSYSSVTIETWVTTGVNSEPARIFQFGPSLVDPQPLSVAVIRFYSDEITSQYSSSTGVYTLLDSKVTFDSKSNIHIVMTIVAGSSAVMYINGVYVNTNFAPGQLQPTYFYLSKSLNPGGNDGLIGSIDEFRIWGGILTPSQIASHYQEGPSE